jgi:hypothetical protein
MIYIKETDDITKLASMALERPQEFGYWGFGDMFKTWGFTGHDKSRDSNLMDLSNFNVISQDLIDQFPEDYRIETYKHWAVGSVDRLVCRILLDEDKGCVEDNITNAFKLAVKWHIALIDYPIADENNYQEAIYRECISVLENMEDYLLLVIDQTQEGWVEKIYHTLTDELNFEFYPHWDLYPDDNKILEAALKSGLCNPDRWGEWYEWCDEQGFDRPIWPVKEDPNQLKLFEDM